MIRNLLLTMLSVAALAVPAAERELTVAPGQGTFLWLDTKVPANNKETMVFHLDLPRGLIFDKDGYINKRRYTAGPQVRCGEVSGEASPDHAGYKRTNLAFSFAQNCPIQLATDSTYDIKLRLRYDLKGIVEVLTSWYSPNGSLLTYKNAATLTGKSDWTDVTYTVKSGPGDKMFFWFNHWAGAEVNGEIELQSMEIYSNGKKIELNNNDFTQGLGGWEPGCVRFNPDRKTLTFTFHGPGAQGSHYAEKGYAKPSEEFRSAPFFRVAPVTAEGDYPIYLSGPGMNEKIIVKVRKAKPVLPKTVEAAMWLCESPFFSYSPAARKATLDACHASGINALYVDAPTPGGHPWSTDWNAIKLDHADEINSLADKGFKIYGYLAYEDLTQSALVKSYLEKHPEAVCRDWAGRPMPRVCPTYMMYENPEYWATAEAITTRTFKETKISGLYWDIEFLTPLPTLGCTKSMADDPMSGCFCDRCIKRFKEEYHISDLGAKEMFPIQLDYNYDKMSADVKNIIQRHPLEWIRFSLTRPIWQVEKLRNALKAVNPAAEMRAYTGLYTVGRWDLPAGGIERWSEFCGIDWTRMHNVVDTIMGCHDCEFYSVPESIMLREISGRKKPVILDISTLGYYGDKHRDYYARIMHIIAFCEAQGFGIWGFWEVDGCDFSEISRAMQDVAKLEDFFTQGRHLDSLHKLSGESKDVNAASWILGSRRAIFVENCGAKPAKAELTVLGVKPAAKARYRATMLDGTKLDDPEKISLELPPASMKVILLEDVSFKPTE